MTIFDAARTAHNSNSIDAAITAGYVPVNNWHAKAARIVRTSATQEALIYGNTLNPDMPLVPSMREAVRATLAWEDDRRAGCLEDILDVQECLSTATCVPLHLNSVQVIRLDDYCNIVSRRILAPCATMLDTAALVSDWILPEDTYLHFTYLGWLGMDRQGRAVAVLVKP